jgi:2-polyprenyl-6-methoxyphenol hydroxylase-like FAD-dependent oxidoreductase
MQDEIIIIGAGATGLSAAIFLIEKGYKVLIFEKRERAKITKALGVNPNTMRLFESYGITKRFLGNGLKIQGGNFWFKDKLIHHTDFSDLKHEFPFMLVQPQFETEAILEEYLKEKGVLVERNFELLSLKTNAQITKLELLNLNDKTSLFIETKGIIIGADGSKSKVRDEIGIQLKGWEHNSVFNLYDLKLHNITLPKNEVNYVFHKEGAILLLHIKNDIWRVGGNLPNVLQNLPKGIQTGEITWETSFTIREMVSEKLNVGNIFLLGDAAHIHSPLGGRGMNMCIEDAHIFADFLSKNKQNEYSDFRLIKLKQTVGALAKMTEFVGGQHFIGNMIRSQMINFKFLFPLFMPKVKKFLLGIN